MCGVLIDWLTFYYQDSDTADKASGVNRDPMNNCPVIWGVLTAYAGSKLEKAHL